MISSCADSTTACIKVTVRKLIKSMMIIIIHVISFAITPFVFHLHKYLNGGPDVIQDRETVKLQESFPLFLELAFTEMVYLIV